MTKGKILAHQPVSQENLGWVRYNFLNSLDNLSLRDEAMAIREAQRYKEAGGGAIVDVTPIGAGRDPEALARISRSAGLNVIMGTGFYLEETWPPGLDEDAMVERMVRELTVSVDDTGICAGLIGEIGTEMLGGIEAGYRQEDGGGRTKRLADSYLGLLRAAARAQQETGAPINIHPGHSPDLPFEIVEVLAGAGADISRVVMSHIERTIFSHDTRVRLARTGCCLEYDCFSWEGYHPVRHVLSEENPVKCDMPNDATRVNEIMALIEDGFLNQILISHDHCTKHRLWSYGGPGYAHILDNVVPQVMRDKGMTDAQIRAITADNPKRLFTFC